MTTTYEPNVVLSKVDYDVVGTRPIRPDGADKVTGRAKYGADLHAAGALYGKILRSPHAHANIKSIDTSKAKAHPAVRAVVTGADLPETVIGPGGERPSTSGDLGTDLKFLRDGIMATKKVVFRGHPVAAVAATSQHDAEEAAKLIEVEYEVLEPVSEVKAAMADDASILHDDIEMTEFGEKTGRKGNIADHSQNKIGDPAKGFEEADIIVEREFNTATVHQGYIEPHTCTVHWRDDGRIFIWNSCQGPFNIRDATAEILGVPLTDVKLMPQEIGGGFGGKFEPYGEPVLALMSKMSGHPVKMWMSRADDFESTGPSPGSYIKVKMGATKEGRLVAGEAMLAFEAGAYPGSAVASGAECIFAPYDIPNAIVDAYDVVLNKPKTAAYRAPGAANSEFASETVVDEIAQQLGIDPIEFRLMNAAKEGTRKVDGTVFPRIGLVEVLEALKDHPHWSTPLEGENVGRGFACAYWMNAGLQSAVTLAVTEDGRVSLLEGSPDIGGSRASISMQAAEILGIPAEDIHPSVVDTDSIGFTFGTGGSRTTFATGWAAIEAARDINQQMIERAAMIWGVEADSLQMEKGVISSKTDSELSMTFKALAAEMNDTGGAIMGRGSVNPSGVGAAFAGLIVDVHVDPETGKTQVLRATIAQDAGKAIHPSYVEGQLQGGTAQGIGWGLNEEYFMTDDGRMANSSFLDYRMPTALDVPMIDTVIVEVANPGHPFGVRGVGEVNIAPPPAALANAISQAINVRMTRLPMNPNAVMEAQWANDSSNGA
jgi:xanthine dehydrogenase molybdenum-binding subunit